MKITIVASSQVADARRVVRHVEQLALGLARRGADVELLAQDVLRSTSRLASCERVLVRWWHSPPGPLRHTLSPAVSRQLRMAAATADVVDVHTDQVPVAMAAVRAGPDHLVLTPHASIRRLMAWPHPRALARLVEDADQILCGSGAERDLLCRTFPLASERVGMLPLGLDIREIRSAPPFPLSGRILLAVGPLEVRRRIDRAIAALPSLDSTFRLVVLGDGPARRQLQAYASDLRVSARVWWLPRPMPDALFYRWLRTATTALVLGEEENSGLHVAEALTAGTPVVASDIAVHREIAVHAGAGSVTLVPIEGSPLDVADGVVEAIALGAAGDGPSANGSSKSWDDVVAATLSAYARVLHSSDGVRHVNGRNGTVLPSENGLKRAQV